MPEYGLSCPTEKLATKQKVSVVVETMVKGSKLAMSGTEIMWIGIGGFFVGYVVADLLQHFKVLKS